MKNFLRYTVFLGFVLFVFFITTWIVFLHTPIVTNQPFHYLLLPETTGKQFASDVHQNTQLKSIFLFRVLIKVRRADARLQAGEYLFPVGSTPNAILNDVLQGKMLNHAFTIVDGWNYNQLMNALQKAPDIKHVISSKTTMSELARTLKLPYKHLEGLFLPETYYYNRGATDLSILVRASKAMQKVLQAEWNNRNGHQHLPYQSPYEALIVASMIEKETSLERERPMIAAVILKRLKKGMMLQIDPTVIYALGTAYHGKLHRKDLKFPSPYNTYLHYGLPPTPISMPGRSSIHAAFHPAETDALYFVAKGDGSHEFSSSLKRHDQAIKRYELHLLPHRSFDKIKSGT